MNARLFKNSGLLLFILTCILNTDIGATHVLGGDLQYTCVGTNSYDILLTVYRDCNGISLPNTQTVDYTSSSCVITNDITISRTSIVEISPLCPSEASACGGGSGTIGIEEHVYTGNLTFSQACPDWIFSYRLCCRSNAITNLINGNSDAIYYEVHLDGTVSPCNNSPEFNSEPLFIGCQGDVLTYDVGAVDPDGDSLAFKLKNCLENAGDVVEYAAGYSGTNPMTAPSTLTLDPVTGIVSIDAQTTDVSAVCVVIEEYRNGTKIGESIRDFSIYIQNCSNDAPSLSNIQGETSDSISTCVGSFCMSMDASDANSSDNVVTDWNQGIPGATFTPGAPGNPSTSQFCWNCTLADTGFSSFIVTAEDNGCPVTLPTSRQYVIELLPCVLNGDFPDFTGVAEHNGNVISWRMTERLSRGECILEKSGDEENFTEIFRPESLQSAVKYTDTDIRNGSTYYYRLKNISNDNEVSYSDVVSVRSWNGFHTQGISMYPVPATDHLSFRPTSAVKTSNYRVFDLQGRLVMRRIATMEAEQHINVSNLTPGTYVLDVGFENGDRIEESFVVGR